MYAKVLKYLPNTSIKKRREVNEHKWSLAGICQIQRCRGPHYVAQLVLGSRSSCFCFPQGNITDMCHSQPSSRAFCKIYFAILFDNRTPSDSEAFGTDHLPAFKNLISGILSREFSKITPKQFVHQTGTFCCKLSHFVFSQTRKGTQALLGTLQTLCHWATPLSPNMLFQHPQACALLQRARM